MTKTKKPGRDLTLKQTRSAAAALVVGNFLCTTPVEDPEGRSEEHMAWMLDRIVHDPDMKVAKASRWLGFVQAWLVLHHWHPLEYVKENVRSARDGK